MADLEAVISGALEAAGNTLEGDGGHDLLEGVDAADIGGDAADGSGSADASSGATGDEGTTGGATAPPATGEAATGTQEAQTAAKEPVVEDAFAKEHGLEPPKKGKDNRIPYSRVQAITTNAVKKVAEAIPGLALDAAKPVADQVKEHVTGLTTKIASYEEQKRNYDAVEAIMVNEPERFLSMLPHVNPKFAELLNKQPAAAAATATTPATAPDAAMPQPDVDLGNGVKTYSQDGLQKLLDWNTQRAAQAAIAQFNEKMAPITSRFEHDQRVNAALTKTRAMIAHAEGNWPGFKDMQADVLKALQEDRTGSLSFHDAYIKVKAVKDAEAMARLTTDRNKIRQEVLDEIKKAPTSTSGTPSSTGKAAPAATPGTRSLEAIIAEKVRQARV